MSGTYKHREFHLGHILLKIRHEISGVKSLKSVIRNKKASARINHDLLTRLIMPVPLFLRANSAE
jgi:hypothetical protein